MRVLPTLVLILTIGFGPAFGLEDSPPATGESGGAHDVGFFDELIRAAYEESPELRAAYHRWRATLERVPQAEGLPDPILGYGYFIERMETRLIFRVEQMIPGWGKRGLRGSVAEEAAKVAGESLEAVAADVRLRVIRAAANFLLASQALERVEKNLELVEQLHAVARQRYRAHRREALSDLRAARQGREGLFNQRKSEARMALYRTRDAIRQVDLFADSLLPRARQTLEIIQTDNRGGKASFLDLIEAQRKVLELELGWLKARTDAVVASAEWERLGFWPP